MASPTDINVESGTLIPENLLKKRKSQERAREERALATQSKRDKTKSKTDPTFTRAEKLIAEYNVAARERTRLNRESRKVGSIQVPDEGQLVFIVRLKGAPKMDARKKRALQLLRLQHMYTGVFMKLTKETAGLLKVIEPLITWGTPSQKSVRELIYKRGYANLPAPTSSSSSTSSTKSPTPLTSNQVVEDHLSHLGFICIEDLIHEIFTLGPNFKVVTNFLCPFKLNSPQGVAAGGKSVGFGKRRKIVQAVEQEEEGGGKGKKKKGLVASGNKEDGINALIGALN